jgi:sucrose-6-phosphate hydrolase SacC (GH32 family)
LALGFFAALVVPIASAWGDTIDGAPAKYAEPLRPQFHFTARKNWLNDPNGLVFFQDEYHQFFQYNPLGVDGGDFKAWGHAVSPDLVHWRELDMALKPDKLGSIWSGSAVVDWQNTSGFQTGGAPPLVAIYTTAGGKLAESKGEPFTQSIAYSNDRGRTWKKYSRNPVVRNISRENRDPKVVWHEPSKHWVMALYLADDRFALLTSPDLKEWKMLDEVRIAGSSECPDFFPMPIENEPGVTKWIFWSASNTYLIGDFDGRKFVDQSGPLRDVAGANYAAQTFSDIPAADGRRVQMAWMRDGRYPGMPFNQQMSFPVVLALRRFPEGLRLTQSPVKELSLLHDRRYAWSGKLDSSTNPLSDLTVDSCEIRATIDPAEAKTIAFTFRGLTLTYDVATHRLSTPKFHCTLPMTDGKVRLAILVDRMSIEVFAQDGRVLLTECFLPPADDRRATLSGAGAKVESLEYWNLKSSWSRSEE